MSIKKLAFVSMACLMLGSVPMVSGTMVASASQVNVPAKTTQKQELSEQTQDIADKYIHFNGTVFVLSDDAKNELTGTEFNQVQAQVNDTNYHLSTITDDDKLMNNITVVDTNVNQIDLSNNLTYKFGKTAVKVYWNFVRVWV